MKNWKTTLCGVLTIVTTVSVSTLNYLQHGTFPDIQGVIAGIGAGIGLLTAKDFDVTGTGTGAKSGGDVDNTK